MGLSRRKRLLGRQSFPQWTTRLMMQVLLGMNERARHIQSECHLALLGARFSGCFRGMPLSLQILETIVQSGMPTPPSKRAASTCLQACSVLVVTAFLPF